MQQELLPASIAILRSGFMVGMAMSVSVIHADFWEKSLSLTQHLGSMRL
jgi:hypothetical protein